MCSRGIIYMFLVGNVFGFVKTFNTGNFSDTMNVLMSDFAWWYYTLSFTSFLHSQ